jgi:chromosome partitioning protein
MIVVVGGIKGGSGKTMVATNLAVIHAAEGRDVLRVDADDQETATDFTVRRNERAQGGAGYTSIKLTGPAVRTETLRLHDKYQNIIIDTGGRDTASQRAAPSVASARLVPFVARSFDVWTMETVAGLVAAMWQANPDGAADTFLNRADPRGQDNDDAAEALRDTTALTFIDTPLGARQAYSNAAAQGVAVTELKPAGPKASEEILALYRPIFDTAAAAPATRRRA